jgi:tRNA uridine 5-carboxymethylaminomethyl modification enzyme
VNDARWAAFSRKSELVARESARWATARVIQLDAPGRTNFRSLLELLRRPGSTYDSVAALAPDVTVSRETLRREAGRDLADQAIDQLESSTKYAGYVEKQKIEVGRTSRAASTRIPSTFDFACVHALSFETKQVLSARRPETVGEAARLPGLTPAAISLLLVELKKHGRADAPVRRATPTAADA